MPEQIISMNRSREQYFATREKILTSLKQGRITEDQAVELITEAFQKHQEQVSKA